jgi:hypothetical protein
MELDDRRLPLQRPDALPRGSLVDAGFVDKDDYPALTLGSLLKRMHTCVASNDVRSQTTFTRSFQTWM